MTRVAVPTRLMGIAVLLAAFASGCKPAEVKPDPAAEAQARDMMQQYDKRPAAAPGETK